MSVMWCTYAQTSLATIRAVRLCDRTDNLIVWISDGELGVIRWFRRHC